MALSAILSAAKEGAGAIGGGIGSIFNTIGAIGQFKETKKQANNVRNFGQAQLNRFGETYSELESLTANQATYKGDTSEFRRAEAEAKRQQLMAGQVNPADQIARDQARQSTSNYIDQASRGARSGVDLMTIAGLGSAAEGQSLNAINANSSNQRMTAEQRANENLLNSLARTASATARERGLEFDSLNRKQDNQFGIARERGLGRMDLMDRNFQDTQISNAAIANARASIWSGVGDTFRAIGGGIADANMESAKMEYMKGFGGV